MDSLRIAMISQGHRTLPPSGSVISAPNTLATALAKELQRFGHKVTLFAAANSTMGVPVDDAGLSSLLAAKAQAGWSDAQYLDLQWQYDLYAGLRALRSHPKFDVIHAHDYRRLPFLAPLTLQPVIYSLHGTIPSRSLSEPLKKILSEYRGQQYVVAASRAQQNQSAQEFRWAGIIPHGIEVDQIPFANQPSGEYLFVGRLIPGKQPDHAIRAALAASVPLRIIGQPGAHESDAQYFEQTLEPLFGDDAITYQGYIPHPELLSEYGAKALLFPTAYQEAFGMVMIEAMAAGTPIIAYDRGPVREIIADSVTGYVVDPRTGIEGLTQAIRTLEALNLADYQAMRRACRSRVEQHFSLNAMARGYERLYQSVLSE